MTLRIALHELDQLVDNGLTAAEFDATRSYLMNNVYVMTATEDQQLGYALDSAWYGIGEFTAFMRQGLERLTVDQVNRAIRTHLNARNLSIVCITRDVAALRQALETDAASPIRYDGAKPPSLLAEDQTIGARRLNIAPSNILVTPVADVFAR
jgi:zinc protease